MKKYGGKAAAKGQKGGSGRVQSGIDCWDGKKQGPSSKNKGFGSK